MDYCNPAANGRFLVYAMCIIGIFGAFLFYKLLVRSHKDFEEREKGLVRDLKKMVKEQPLHIIFLLRALWSLLTGGVYVGFSAVMILACFVIGPGLLIAGIGSC